MGIFILRPPELIIGSFRGVGDMMVWYRLSALSAMLMDSSRRNGWDFAVSFTCFARGLDTVLSTSANALM